MQSSTDDIQIPNSPPVSNIPIPPPLPPLVEEIRTEDLYEALNKLSARREKKKKENSTMVQLGLTDDVPKKRQKSKGSLKRQKSKRNSTTSSRREKRTNSTEKQQKVAPLKPGVSRSLEDYKPPEKQTGEVTSRGFLCFLEAENSQLPIQQTFSGSSGDEEHVPDWVGELRAEWAIRADPNSEEGIRASVFSDVNEILACKETSLNMSLYDISSTLCLAVATSLSGSNLEHLIINSNILGDSGIASVATMVEKCPLKSLKMKGFFVKGSNRNPTEITTIGIRQLANAIAGNRTLKKLDISHNNIDYETILPLLGVLENSSCIENVILSHNPLGNEVSGDLRLLLEKNSTIKKIKLRNIKLTTEGSMNIFNALEVNRTLKKIVIQTKNSYSLKQMNLITSLAQIHGIIIVILLICGKTEITSSSRKKLDNILNENLSEARRVTTSIRQVISSTRDEISKLDLTGCGLQELEFQFDYTLLTELLISNNELTELFQKIGLLRNLEILHIQKNKIQILPEEISGCISLTSLNISMNEISKLPSKLYELKNLKILIAFDNKLKNIPVHIRELEKLQILDISYNEIKEYPPITIPSLTSLNISNNQIEKLPNDIGMHPNLISLLMTNNRLEVLPSSLTKLSNIHQLAINGNPLSTIPRGVKQRGAKAIFPYLNSDGGELVSMVKLFVIGPHGSGKTSLIESLFDKETFTSALHAQWKKKRGKNKDTSMEGICKIQKRTYTYDDITFETWNFHGDGTIILPTHKFFGGGNTVYIIPFNVVGNENDIDPWIVSVASHVGQCPIIIVATFIDDKSLERDYVSELLNCLHARYRDRFTNIVAYMAVSNIRTKKGIKELRSQICEIIRQKGMSEHRVPKSHILAKKLENYKDHLKELKQPPVMKWNDFENIGNSLSLSSGIIQEAIHFYHNSGKINFYEQSNHEILQQTIFLDPQWMIDAFSNIYKYKKVLLPEGRLLCRDLPTIWTEPKYPSSIHKSLLALFEQFEILLPLPKRNSQPESFIIPSFLLNERPENVKTFWPTFEDNLQNINRIWEFKSLPSNFFPKLITRTAHLPIDIEGIWKTGMIIKCGQSNKALLEYNPSLFRLKLKLRLGEYDKTENFANLIISSINVFIEGWYQNQLTNVLLPCTHCILEHSFDPFIFSLSDCELCAARGKRYAHCRGIRPVRIDLLAPDVAMADVPHLDRKSIELGKELGEGSFARVYKATYKGDTVAVKVIKLDNEHSDSLTQNDDDALRERFVEFRKEVSLMSGLVHANLVELKGLCLDSSEMLMVTEFLAGGDLYNFLHDTSNRIPWSLRIKIAFDIAKGMNFLHTTTPPIIHRDLKTPNILLAATKSNAKVCAKVADFGLSSTLVHTVAGRDVFNPTWLAPEVMVPGAEYTEKADVYSYGIVLWELVTRETPFDEFNITFSSELENQIIHKNLRPTIPDDCSKPFAKLIKLCWHANPEKRPNFTDIVNALKEMQPHVAPTLRGHMSVADLKRKTMTFTGRSSDPTIKKEKDDLPVDIKKPILLGGQPSAPKEDEMTNYMAVSHVTLNPPHSGSVKCMAVIGDHIWVGCGDGIISIWSSKTKQIIQELDSSDDCKCGINALLLVRDTVWASQDNALTIWNTKNLEKNAKKLKNSPYGALSHVGKSVWCATIEPPNAIHIRSIDVSYYYLLFNIFFFY